MPTGAMPFGAEAGEAYIIAGLFCAAIVAIATLDRKNVLQTLKFIILSLEYGFWQVELESDFVSLGYIHWYICLTGRFATVRPQHFAVKVHLCTSNL